ncbi:META domain-containing protein [Helicobacter pametensis]|uniref:META domain-containing protein n=1 Tax=Helicobacter pametensis TaxID=95149 RepID=UPI0004BC3507|nr:META domain-containing protein [Helicobacter pametensis]
MRRFSFIFQFVFIALFLNGCFLANIFDLGPKIDLAKNNWKITSFTLGKETYTPNGYEEIPSLRFDTQELKLYGNTGCNAFFATYVWLDDQKLEMRNSGMTRKMCSEEAIRFEQKLMEEFDGDFEVHKEGKNLILKRENLQITLSPLEVSANTATPSNVENKN